MHNALLVFMMSCLGFVACAPMSGPMDGGSNSIPVDGGPGGGTLDGGNGAVDSGAAPDASVAIDGGSNAPRAGFGEIGGDCDVLDSELSDTSPHFFVGNIDFGTDPFDVPDDVSQLTTGGQEILADGNLGGSSQASEIFAYEVLARCENASLLKTESEILYSDPMGKKTDLLLQIDGLRIGVSVTRAMTFPPSDTYPLESATDLLSRKLDGVRSSSDNVHPDDRWQKQILAIMAYGPDFAERLREAWDGLDAATKADTILYVTVTNGEDSFIY